MPEVERQEEMGRKKAMPLKKTLTENSKNKFLCKSYLKE